MCTHRPPTQAADAEQEARAVLHRLVGILAELDAAIQKISEVCHNIVPEAQDNCNKS